MKKIKLILVLVSIAIFVSSPCHAEEWAFSYGGTSADAAYSIQQTTDGGYVVGGDTYSFGAKSSDCWVFKLDAGGNVTWQKTYGGSRKDAAYSIQQTAGGGYVVAGYHEYWDGEQEDYDVLVSKLDGNGNVTWQNTYGGTGYWDRAKSVVQTTAGPFVIAGDSGGDFDVLKLGRNGGVKKWRRVYCLHQNDNAAYSIQETTDGGYIVAGDACVLKIDDSGIVIWQKTYGEMSEARSIQQTADGGYVVAGVHAGHACVLKLDGSGNVIWLKAYDVNGYSSSARSLQLTTDGGYVVAGTARSFDLPYDYLILKLDDSGNIIWQKTYGGRREDVAYSIQQTTDGGYVVAGYTDSFGRGRSDAWILKLDSNGEIPGCTVMGTGNTTVIETSTTVSETIRWAGQHGFLTWAESFSAKDAGAERTRTCGESPPSILKIVPAHGPYGAKIIVKGGMFGAQRTSMINQQEGYYSFATFSGTQTLIATECPLWSDGKIRMKFQNLFVDEDGDFLQDGDEPTLPVEQILLEDYWLRMSTLWFEDLNTNGVYDEGDSILGFDSSNPVLFTLADEPGLLSLIPNSTPASVPGNAVKVKIKGLKFGDTQGSSLLHIDAKTWAAGHPKIPVWRDDAIKFKVPKYDPPFPKYKEIWVTVDGKDSNKKWLKITAP